MSKERPRVRFLVPVWGESYITRFLDLSLPSFLAPGNLPGLAELSDLEICILTVASQKPLFERNRAFQRMQAIAPIHFVDIDDLVVDQMYGITLTLAYLRGLTDVGPAMTEQFFLFMNADLLLADGSLVGVGRKILAGHSVMLAASIRATAEEVEPQLRAAIDCETDVLSIEPRQLVRMAMRHMHPLQVAKIVNSNLCHSVHANQFYWQANATTLVSRHFLLFMLCIKPERVVTSVSAFCDYSFVPEFCPSAVPVAMDDSDEFFFLELQNASHEASFLRPGRADTSDVAASLGRWTTAEHRRNALEHTIVFHGEGISAEVDRFRGDAAAFIEEIISSMPAAAQPYRNHPYWSGSYALWETRRAQLRGTAVPQTESSRRASLQELWYRLVGRPPFVRVWHPAWLDFRAVRAALAEQQGRCLYVSSAPGVLRHLARERTMRLSDLLAVSSLATGSGGERPRAVVVELLRDELPRVRALIEHLAALMGPGGRIILFYKAQWSDDAWVDVSSDVIHAVSRIAPQEVHKVDAAFAGGTIRARLERSMYRALGELSAPGIRLLAAAARLPVLFVLSAILNWLQTREYDSRRPHAPCHSVSLIVRT